MIVLIVILKLLAWLIILALLALFVKVVFKQEPRDTQMFRPSQSYFDSLGD